jgi:hypothetical protein
LSKPSVYVPSSKWKTKFRTHTAQPAKLQFRTFLSLGSKNIGPTTLHRETAYDEPIFIGFNGVSWWVCGFSEPHNRLSWLFDSRRELGIFLFTTLSRTSLEPIQPPIQRVSGVPSLGVKRPGREADHSPPSSAEVKNAWSYTSTPPIRLHGVALS